MITTGIHNVKKVSIGKVTFLAEGLAYSRTIEVKTKDSKENVEIVLFGDKEVLSQLFNMESVVN